MNLVRRRGSCGLPLLCLTLLLGVTRVVSQGELLLSIAAIAAAPSDLVPHSKALMVGT
jgi:hypothetical protein